MTGDRRLAPHPDAVLRRVGDGAVLVHLGSGHVYELNETAARAWELASEGRTQSAIVTALASEFAASAGVILADVQELFDFLDTRGLMAQ